MLKAKENFLRGENDRQAENIFPIVPLNKLIKNYFIIDEQK